jgi:hypothetical protein
LLAPGKSSANSAAPRLVLRQDLGLSSFGVTVASRHGSCPKILHQMMKENGTCLLVGVPDDIAAGHRVGQGGGKRRDVIEAEPAVGSTASISLA